jgi:hypothetical protein
MMGPSLTTAQVPRALRFPLKLQMRYRVVGMRNWFPAQVANIGATGLLFQAREELQPGAAIEISVDLPGTANGCGGARIVGSATIVRRQGSERMNETVLLGAQIAHSRIVHMDRPG